jgi:hypothetical protein
LVENNNHQEAKWMRMAKIMDIHNYMAKNVPNVTRHG